MDPMRDTRTDQVPVKVVLPSWLTKMLFYNFGIWIFGIEKVNIDL